MIFPFRKATPPPFLIERKGDCVYVTVNQKIADMTEADCDRYLAELSAQIKQTVSAAIWDIITHKDRTRNPEYNDYVEGVKENLIQTFGLEHEREEVGIGLYHGGQFVISFPLIDGMLPPLYFQGVQLKPFRPL